MITFIVQKKDNDHKKLGETIFEKNFSCFIIVPDLNMEAV